MKINLNLVAREIASMEKGKKEVSIAQIKEVMKCFLKILNRHWNSNNEVEVIRLIKKQRGKLSKAGSFNRKGVVK